ncbi:DegV family protein [Enterococcus timonensis]|uniref:DegV family protein n=1 Tax=Enterococcus timonensis TaxID=1852364 RepID=UPI0008DA1231|nr:DegV family protein [Enterococcus timonensis]
MSNIKIVTDSSCTMDPKLISDLDITVVPLSVMLDGVMYTADENFDNVQFMKLMAESNALPKTSQPPIGVFAETYEKLTADGSTVISIHLTEKLSGTVEAARQASHLVKGKVIIVDSNFIDQSLAQQVIMAAQLAQQGRDEAEIVAATKSIAQRSKLFIGISNLENLIKGGRISKAKGVVTTLFNIKLVLELKDGNFEPVAKGRGSKTFFKWLQELKRELQNQTVEKMGISYAGDASLAKEIAGELQELFPNLEIPVFHTNPVVATHAGDGAFAIMYYTK